MRFVRTATIRAAPERVWAVLSDWEGQARWMPDVAWIRLLGSERALGARLAVRTKVFGIPAATDGVTVTVWEPPHRLRIDHRGVVDGWGEWQLEPHASEATRFTWIEEFRMPPPVLGDLALWIYSPWQRFMLARSIRNLTRLAEGRNSAS